MWSIKWDVLGQLWVCKVQWISRRKVVSSCIVMSPCTDADTVDAIVTKLESLK